jgi:acetaldehyde dehydrogenase (acetylating)
MKTVTIEGTQELMKHRDVAVILATGGMGLVRAAYSSGKPAYGVGPGNAPCYVERSADLRKAASDIVVGKTFDNGVLCSSPNSVVVDESVDEKLRRELEALGAYFMNQPEMEALAKGLVTPQRLPNPALVGKAATHIARQVGIKVPDTTTALIAPLAGVGRDYPLSIEKLAPILSWYVVKDWRDGCERCIQILRYGGMGHTMSIHSRNEEVILQFGLKKPAFRICVNTPTTHGSIGLTTGLDPAMTLGCGGFGGNITSDNITPKHLLNIKRLAYEVRPARTNRPDDVMGRLKSAPTSGPVPAPSEYAGAGFSGPMTDPALPKAPAHPVATGIPAETLASRIDQFLASRGYTRAPETSGSAQAAESDSPADFVCEDDVRAALRAGRKLVVGERTIITPAARDLGESRKVFVQAGWPR